MNAQELIAWFKEIEAKASRVPQNSSSNRRAYTTGEVKSYNSALATGWIVEASSAISEVYNLNHPLRKQWDVAAQHKWRFNKSGFEQLVEAFRTATRMVEQGRVQSLADTLRADSESDLLDQATDLNDNGHRAAATVIAGGTLEMHLRHLCEKNNLSWTGNGSISAYEVAIGKERKNGNEILSKSAGKQVTAWGGKRNDAAHSPGTYTAPKEAVQIMIDGIRQFIINHP